LQADPLDRVDSADSDDSDETNDPMEQSLRMNESWQRAYNADKAAAREEVYIAEAVGAPLGLFKPSNPTESVQQAVQAQAAESQVALSYWYLPRCAQRRLRQQSDPVGRTFSLLAERHSAAAVDLWEDELAQRAQQEFASGQRNGLCRARARAHILIHMHTCALTKSARALQCTEIGWSRQAPRCVPMHTHRV
jgi:hypothetical protein